VNVGFNEPQQGSPPNREGKYKQIRNLFPQLESIRAKHAYATYRKNRAGHPSSSILPPKIKPQHQRHRGRNHGLSDIKEGINELDEFGVVWKPAYRRIAAQENYKDQEKQAAEDLLGESQAVFFA